MSYCVKPYSAVIFFAMFITFIAKSNAYNIYQSSGWSIIKSDNHSLVLSYKPKFNGFDTIITKSGIKTLNPIIKGTEQIGNPGEPVTLISRVNITVPSQTGFELKTFKVKNINSFQEKIAPVPHYVKNESFQGAIYSINEEDYQKHSIETLMNAVAYGEQKVKFEYSGIARNRHIATLEIIVACYENSLIKIPEEILIELVFDDTKKNEQNNISDNWDLPISINHMESKQWLIPKTFNSSFDKLSMTEQKKEKVLGTTDAIWIKIKVDKEGLYRITPALLADLGYSISKDEIPTIKIYGNGGLELSERVSDAVNNKLNEQGIIVNTNSNGELSQILFYGSPANGFKYISKTGFRHYINHYSDDNYYILTWKGSDGKRAIARKSPEGTVVNRPTTYLNLLFFEEELESAYLGGSGRTWFGRNNLPVTFTEQLNNLDRTGKIYLGVSFAHRGIETGYMKLKVNNNLVMNESLNWISGYTDAYRIIKYDSIPATYISQDNRASLQFDYSSISGGASSNGYFDWYEIQYPAYLIPTDNQIGFFTEPSSTGLTEYSINNFSNSDIFGFDVTNPANPELLENISNIGNMFVFRNDNELYNPKRYFITSNIKTPILEKAEYGGLRNNIADADMIVITHPKLIESAEAYKKYRETQSNIKVQIARTDHIFDEFSSCLPDPTAIRDYISFSFNKWNIAPRYILLWGDGQYDYKGISTSETNFVPCYETEDDTYSFNEIGSYTSDDYFANVSGDDDLIDIAIGRLPVYSEAIGNWLVEKINSYENYSNMDSWRTKMTIVADDSWKFKGYDQTMHTSQAESLWTNIVPNDFQVKKIYLAEYPAENVTGGKRKPRVNEEILSNVNTSGTLLMSYIGHGNPRVWAHEEVFERSITVPQMKNADKLFFLTAASCDFGRFDTPEIRSGAEELILSKLGGAIGVLSSTRLVFADANAQLNELLFENIFSKNPDNGLHNTMGEVSYRTKYIKRSDNDKKYCLLGDPAVKLLLPENNTIIEKINDVDVTTGDTAIIQALSLVEIKGRITNPSSTTTDKSFNGTVIITMLDSDKYIQVLEDDGTTNGTIHRFFTNGGALNRSSYKVVDGEFTAEFYIPKDISFSGLAGRLYAYSYTDDNRFALGNTRNFIISGITDVKNPDNKGPEIEIYLDSRDFVSGNIVQCVPVLIVDLSDESGINTTGLGLGHRIEAWIDDAPVSIDLTEKFKTSVEIPGSGTVEELLYNLNPGLHKVTVRAWDVFNNYSKAETFFRTDNCGRITIGNLHSYPNPTSEISVIKFNHNISPPFTSELIIANILGQEIYSSKQQISTSHIGEMEWNGYDNYGNMVPVGSYFYIINLETFDGIRNSERNILTIIR
ncbi:MAG: type IX secretion system sortase PorU [bacterium]